MMLVVIIKHKNTAIRSGVFLFIHRILAIGWFADKLNDPVAAIMPETNHITAGIALCFMYPSFFHRSNNTIPAGMMLYHPLAYQVLS